MDNRLNENSKKVEEPNTTLTNQCKNFRKNQAKHPQRGSFSQNRRQNLKSPRAYNRGHFRGHFRGKN